MKKRRSRLLLFVMVCAAMVIGYSLFNKEETTIIPPKQAAADGGTAPNGGEVTGSADSGADGNAGSDTPDGDKGESQTLQPDGEADGGQEEQTEDGLAVIAKPEEMAVLVNKQRKLPEEYNPSDLVYPDVRFIFSEKVEKRKMRQEAASALEKLFAAAEDDSIQLAGVSAYRSHSTQKTLFERYVKRDGLEKARTYSAFPGTSEHETGLAIDVSGSDGKCAAADCFADTKEAQWLAEHAHEHGFIIRYLKGKEEITGYQYEPWHLRYVGVDLAAELAESGESLEEYFDAVPVTQ
ncbi:D-alanyl-D-alanine carboxypeptidase family protein [Paenibacillus sp. LHD-38]|uniref:M15 family metallopeptidase n=1 Tax=Paenibacillus sp. LHD-38 TaxID=3072143 RepID=UPI00280E43B1|nr:D-alanyl-D-alanine carboxypeptidase family protein [Paenibacillus sp. LHD-38]MDQ8734157.1 D-alanyl-D-alanine carboxypeptidase family protein [Paenibacillus sp. LHD-38]